MERGEGKVACRFCPARGTDKVNVHIWAINVAGPEGDRPLYFMVRQNTRPTCQGYDIESERIQDDDEEEEDDVDDVV